MIVVLFHQFDEGDTTMAEGNSMTAREAASNVMALEHADVLRESVAVMVREIMEAERGCPDRRGTLTAILS